MLTPLCFALALLAAQGSQATQTQTTGAAQSPARDTAAEKKGTAIITGRVVNADGSKPLRQAQVSLSSTALSEPRSVSTTTAGAFEFKELPAGRYTVTASRSGFLRLQYGQRRPGEPGRPIQVADGQTIDRVEFALPRMSVITGHVTDEVGDPLAGVSIFLMQVKYFRGKRRLVPTSGAASTDDTGQFRLIGLQPGDYYVMGTTRETWTVEGDDTQRTGFAPTYYPGTPVPAEAQRVKLGVGQELAGIDLSLVPGRVATISGTVISQNGLPMTGESVSVTQEFAGPGNMSSYGFGGGTIKADGSFTIRNIAPGEYKLSVRLAGDKDRRTEMAEAVVTVTGADIDGVSLVAGSGGFLSGKVITDDGTPLTSTQRMRVSTRSVDSSAGSGRYDQENGRVRDDMTFEVSEVFGRQQISIGPLPSGWAVKSIDHEGHDYADLPVEIGNSQRMDGLTIVLTKTLPGVRGTLLDEKGQPAQGLVILFPADPALWVEGSRLIRTIRPTHAGAFQLAMLPEGEYLVAARDFIEEGSWNDPEVLKELVETATKVTLRQGQGAAAVSLTLRK